MPPTEIEKELAYGLENLEHVHKQIQNFAQQNAGQELKTSALAYECVGYYNAIEHLVIRVLKHLDREMPAGEFSHRETLKVFEKILGDLDLKQAKLITAIETLMAFRHVATKIYGFLIDWSKLQSVLSLIESNHGSVVTLFSDIAVKLARDST